MLKLVGAHSRLGELKGVPVQVHDHLERRDRAHPQYLEGGRNDVVDFSTSNGVEQWQAHQTLFSVQGMFHASVEPAQIGRAKNPTREKC